VLNRNNVNEKQLITDSIFGFDVPKLYTNTLAGLPDFLRYNKSNAKNLPKWTQKNSKMLLNTPNLQ
jgi:hypothetical protein